MELHWEKVNSKGAIRKAVFRTRVPGGWLLMSDWDGLHGHGGSIAFYPDSQHQWTGNSL